MAELIHDEVTQPSSLARMALEVSIDGEVVSTAGLSDPGVLTAILTYHWRQKDSQRKDTISLDVGGHVIKNGGDEIWRWLEKPVAVGSTITLRLLSATVIDEPQLRKRRDPAKIEAEKEAAERAYYEDLKRKYEKPTEEHKRAVRVAWRRWKASAGETG